MDLFTQSEVIMPPNPIHRAYRRQIGFTDQKLARKFLTSKTIDPGIDIDYINRLTDNLCEITGQLNGVIHTSCRHDNLEQFCELNIRTIKHLCDQNGLLPRFNNHFRRIENMFYSWLSGHAMAQFLTPALSRIFDVPLTSFKIHGDDDPSNPETFAQTAKADFKIPFNNGVLIELQAGFQGEYNDIKKSKYIEAIQRMETGNLPTICVMFDVFNGRVGFFRLDQLTDDKKTWVARKQWEGKPVYEAPDEVYRWQISDAPPQLDTLNLNL